MFEVSRARPSSLAPSFSAALRQSLQQLLDEGSPVGAVTDPSSPGSRFGAASRSTLELAGHGFGVEDPHHCLFVSDSRPLRIEYCYGLAVWSLAGSDDVEWLEYYHPKAGFFSDSPEQLSGAFGHRLCGKPGLDQLAAIEAKLRQDPTARRTVAIISMAEDNVRESKEYPCGIGLQFMIRDGRLCLITFMRSQSALMVMPYDVFLFTVLQLALAARLGIEPGWYKHFCGSFHLYDDEVDLATTVIHEAVPSIPVLPVGSADGLAELLRDEADLRAAARSGDSTAVERIAEAARTPRTFEEEARLVFLGMAAKALGHGEIQQQSLHFLRPEIGQMASGLQLA